jgi:hypothetical protein
MPVNSCGFNTHPLHLLVMVCVSLTFHLIVSEWAFAEPNAVTFKMPNDGWATIAINDAAGKRVRNLLSNLPFKAGQHTVEWDGRDDAGELVEPGTYQWIGLHRDDVAAIYRGSFQHGNPPWLYGKTGGWTGDHSSATAVVAVGERMVIGTNEAEWGHGLIASDLAGRKQWGVKWMDKRAWCGAEALAAVGQRVFASSYLGECAIWEVDPATGRNWLALEEGDIPAEVRGDRKPTLRVVGARQTTGGGEVFAADVNSPKPRTLVFSVHDSGQKLSYARSLPIRLWGTAWLPDGRCVAAADESVVVIDVETGKVEPFTSSPISSPWDVATDAAGRVYVADQGATDIHRFTRDGQLSHRFQRLARPASHQIKVFDGQGNLLRAMGREGGREVGAFDPESFFQPAGIDVDAGGRLWVTEFTQSPKRVSVWEIPQDVAANQPTLVHQFFGPAHYGGGAAMIDPEKPWRIMDTNFGVIFDVNLQTGAAQVVEMPWRYIDFWKEHGYRPDQPFAGRPGIIYEVDGRRYSAMQGGYMHAQDARWRPYEFNANGPIAIGEYVDDRFVPRAAIGNIMDWMRGRSLRTRREEQWLARPVLDAAKRLPDWPKNAEQIGMAPDAEDVPHWDHPRGAPFYSAVTWPAEIGGFIWIDADGDGLVQPEEITFFPQAFVGLMALDENLNAYWSVPGWQRNSVDESLVGTWRLPRHGFNEHHAPVYRAEDLERLSADAWEVAHVAEDGSLLGHTSLRAASGRVIWTYPSSSQGIRALGRDSRQVMRPGSIHRVSALQGVVEGPGDLGPIFALHSNDGMKYLLTRDDGLFITTLFRPYAFADGWDSIPQARPGLRLDEYSLQDECFNAHFVRAKASGKGFDEGAYYLLGMSRSAIVEVTGLESVERFAGGDLQLQEGVGRYGRGERFDPAAQAPVPAARRTLDPLIATPPKQGEDMFRGPRVEFAGVQVQAGYRNDGLHLKWQVKGPAGMFENQGSDWTQLFATGGGVELQVRSPKEGLLRFVAGMHEGRPTIIRMRYEGEATEHAVTYRSDVHVRVVPEVRRLDSGYSSRKINDGFVIQMRISWSDLGFDRQPAAGTELPIELGVFGAGGGGRGAQTREFWVSGSGMVADLPTEADPAPRFSKLVLGE